ncbi:Clavaminate synthase-like protein [Rickenella mellea]|uniref:Clavaminate synthase-like protein n=1 Tax=Rickenella mellea TaxID=50990 RepID=A0A4Y7PJ26_9AGAM|nr:Clavaminate synthase-like protein [Rickenella mellea]
MTIAEQPSFPDNIQTHPLLVVDYELIKAGSAREIDTLWEAATELGFWYLKNHGVDDEVARMFDMGAKTMRLPMDEKMKYEQGDDGRSFGYKFAGANATDESGNPDTVEFINISADDALSFPTQTHRTYPSTVNEHMDDAIRPFVRKSIEINHTLLDVLGTQLGLANGALSKRHALNEHSGSEARFIFKPPSVAEITEEKAAIGAHTDFGSLSFLHNRLGGLQVLVPGTETWQYVKPLPGHAICNLGDAMALLSAGILRSNLHRVVPLPPPQNSFPRTSLVFFTRPGNSVQLRALSDESEVIASAAARLFETLRTKYFVGEGIEVPTSAEWFARRIRNQRIKNRTGPETWLASRGTEHQPQAV